MKYSWLLPHPTPTDPTSPYRVWSACYPWALWSAPSHTHKSMRRIGTIYSSGEIAPNRHKTRIHHHCGYSFHPAPHMTDRRFDRREGREKAYQRHLCNKPGNREHHTRRPCGLPRSTHVPHSCCKNGICREEVHECNSRGAVRCGPEFTLSPGYQVTVGLPFFGVTAS